MKRSDMLEIISDVLHPCNSTYKDSRDNTAARILTIMEKAGMLSPCDFKTQTKNVTMRNINQWKWEDE